MYKPIFCICQDMRQTATIVNNLKMAGISSNEISLLFPDSPTLPPLQPNAETLDQDVFGLEWASKIDSLDIPGLGHCIAAGPIMIELSRTPKADQVEDLIDALIGVGIPAHEAKHYQAKIKAGRTLIAVNTATAETRDAANTIFQQAEAEDISSSEEVSLND
jgi:hypothetical protein